MINNTQLRSYVVGLLPVTLVCGVWAGKTPAKKQPQPVITPTVNSTMAKPLSTGSQGVAATTAPSQKKQQPGVIRTITGVPSVPRGAQEGKVEELQTPYEPKKTEQGVLAKVVVTKLIRLLQSEPDFSPWLLRFQFLSLGVTATNFMLISSRQESKMYVPMMLANLTKTLPTDPAATGINSTPKLRAIGQLLTVIEHVCSNAMVSVLFSHMVPKLQEIRAQIGLTGTLPQASIKIEGSIYDFVWPIAEKLSSVLLSSPELSRIQFKQPSRHLLWDIDLHLSHIGKERPDEKEVSRFHLDAVAYSTEHPTSTLADLTAAAFDPISLDSQRLTILKGELILYLFSLHGGGARWEREARDTFIKLLRKKWGEGDPALNAQLALLAIYLMEDNFLTDQGRLPTKTSSSVPAPQRVEASAKVRKPGPNETKKSLLASSDLFSSGTP